MAMDSNGSTRQATLRLLTKEEIDTRIDQVVAELAGTGEAGDSDPLRPRPISRFNQLRLLLQSGRVSIGPIPIWKENRRWFATMRRLNSIGVKARQTRPYPQMIFRRAGHEMLNLNRVTISFI